MRACSDDELYAVQGRYLGPPGKTLPFQALYVSYVIWAGWFTVFLIVRAQLGLFSGWFGIVAVAAAAVLATVHTVRLVTPERPVIAVVARLTGELRGPRPGPGPLHQGAPSPATLLWTRLPGAKR